MKARIQAGIAFLNVMRPNWKKKIDLKKLDLGNPNVCMIGEVCGDYNDGRYELGLSDSQAETLGFQDNNTDDDYKTLTRAWKRALRELGIK